MKTFFNRSSQLPEGIQRIDSRPFVDGVAIPSLAEEYSPGNVAARASAIVSTSVHTAQTPHQAPFEARIAVYDSLTSAPRVEMVTAPDAGSFIDALAARVFALGKEAGGSVPFMVIRELTENFIHAGFAEAVVTILDSGRTIRFSDQGPGIADKDNAFNPGFSTATSEMKRIIKGVGSGLPIARECLQFSKGSIAVDDNLGRGTVVTVTVEPCPERIAEPNQAPLISPADELPRLTTRQKQVLSLVMEIGSVGPTAVANELSVGLSTAYRDLASLEALGLLTGDESGKRVLTPLGVSSLDKLLGL